MEKKKSKLLCQRKRQELIAFPIEELFGVAFCIFQTIFLKSKDYSPCISIVGLVIDYRKGQHI